PWNLYDMLAEFFEIHGIPDGPILLRDIGVSKTSLYAEGHEGHKLAKIAPILERYPHLPFILVGDTSQKDPEIYREVVRTYPERILAVYIRNVTPDPVRQEAVGLLIDEVKEAGSQLVLAHDSVFAATHAAEQGWIPAAAVADVRSEKKRDDRAPDPQEGTGDPKDQPQ
ncbi:MAG: phosphatase domain-containing protein, partial [Pyrinomonadaceae bacterium]